jgi:hypothetical protein
MEEKIDEDNEDYLDEKINKIEEKINEKLAEKINDDNEDDLDEKINKIEEKINEKLEEINDKKEEKSDIRAEEKLEEERKEVLDEIKIEPKKEENKNNEIIEDKKDEQKKEIIENKKETNENNAYNQLSSLDAILKGNEELKIPDNTEKSEEKQDKIIEKDNNNMPFKSLYSDKIEDNSDNTDRPLLSLSEMLKPSQESKKEEKVEDKKEEKVEDKKEEKKGMKKFLTDSYLKPSSSNKGS